VHITARNSVSQVTADLEVVVELSASGQADEVLYLPAVTR